MPLATVVNVVSGAAKSNRLKLFAVFQVFLFTIHTRIQSKF